MAWYLDSVRIFVQDWEETNSQIIPRVQPLSGGTVLQIFGYESKIVKVAAIIVGTDDRDAIRGFAKDGDTHTLYTPDDADLSFYVRNATFRRIQCICQTLRPDLPEDSPVFEVSIELYQED